MVISIIPKFFINKVVQDKEKQIHLNIIVSSALVLIIFSFTGVVVEILNDLPHFCLFQQLFSIPCPGCGIIRSIDSISKLDIRSSLQYNPVGIFIVMSIFIQIPLRTLAILFRNLGELVASLSDFSCKLVLISLLFNWFARISM